MSASVEGSCGSVSWAVMCVAAAAGGHACSAVVMIRMSSRAGGPEPPPAGGLPSGLLPSLVTVWSTRECAVEPQHHCGGNMLPNSTVSPGCSALPPSNGSFLSLAFGMQAAAHALPAGRMQGEEAAVAWRAWLATSQADLFAWAGEVDTSGFRQQCSQLVNVLLSRSIIVAAAGPGYLTSGRGLPPVSSGFLLLQCCPACRQRPMRCLPAGRAGSWLPLLGGHGLRQHIFFAWAGEVDTSG